MIHAKPTTKNIIISCLAVLIILCTIFVVVARNYPYKRYIRQEIPCTVTYQDGTEDNINVQIDGYMHR